MMLWRKRKNRINPAELSAQADAASKQIEDQQPQVNALTEYLERRKLQNGFGADFEYSLKPRESR
ncbi:hypothetical protein BH09ACT9_BH09ACT9_00810 [soil metagenome]